MAVQKKANCVIGNDYPKPIVDEKEARQSCLKKMKEGYEKNQYGTHRTNPSSSSSSSPRKRKDNLSSQASTDTPEPKVAAQHSRSTVKRKPTRDVASSSTADGRSKQLKLDFKPNN
ncbi:hypothetical protein PCASD_12117 [Puccinia coronata f. sp. avenae]|jgi:cryptochrome|uniref:Cryptochrome/DNA photolyase FAD-binding domain-containing protein n=1 Tax=Puccinia coronata f. sp. avenae TaxID=200324 RepID=A0A2N5RYG4_9BASI|nr:hypothetical protein PCASD_24163 [Puccinia coronata f. sp. avenae]PLW35880.1 hypothetical protein PCASD_12117 [Puccinia coronata f. sp. avenae]